MSSLQEHWPKLTFKNVWMKNFLEESNRANISHHCQRNKQIAKANLYIDVQYLV